LIASQFNNADNSVLDGNMIGEYCTMLGREFGASDKDCFFGRVAMPRITQEICPSSTSFVYTNSTVRLLEQIGAGIVGRETVLLVGETGTGKTTAV
jgi:midasin